MDYIPEKDKYNDKPSIVYNNMKLCVLCKMTYYETINDNKYNKENNVCNLCFCKKELTIENITNKIRKYINSNNLNNSTSEEFFKQLLKQYDGNIENELCNALFRLSESNDTNNTNNNKLINDDDDEYNNYCNNLFI